MNEAETCRRYVVPRLRAAGWEDAPYSFTEQDSFTDGRIVVAGGVAHRGPRKRTDYLLRHAADFPIAVVEAKAAYRTPGTGLQQAKDYADLLDLKFAYATNGHGIVEFDYLTGEERARDAFPTPDELWGRLRASSPLSTAALDQLLTPTPQQVGKASRYYQRLAVNRVVAAILAGQRRVLLTMATGTGKTTVAFQICWKLWEGRWNRAGAHRKPRILFLADRNILIDDPYSKTFGPFGDARWAIGGNETQFGREIYFATYQTLAADERRPGRYREFPPDFFDLIVIDECHRGSARDESSWREILDYFAPAVHFGMTATPLRAENEASYRYFGGPVYEYSLRQGIADGFLAPYRVHRVITTYDAAGWRPTAGQLDRHGQEIPDDEYHTRDFERVLSLPARTEAIARHLTAYLRATDCFAKTLVFCVDQAHADEMRRALGNLNRDLVVQYPDYVCRVTSDEGAIGRGHLSNFQDPDQTIPTILTTSQLLTTGVDMPTVKNVVLARVIGSMIEFKQIIGRGTRVREDGDKLFFTILDYTGSATRLFADPAFDGDPIIEQEEVLPITAEEDDEETVIVPPTPPQEPTVRERRARYYVDGGTVEIALHLVYELDADGRQLRTVELADYAAERVRILYPAPADLRAAWADPLARPQVIAALRDRGLDFAALAATVGQPDADPFDLLCHLAFNAPLRTRRERAALLRRDRQDFFARHGPEARAILGELLDKYAAYGTDEFVIPDALRVPPLAAHGTPVEIARHFGGAAGLRAAVTELQALLYAA